MRRLKYGAPSPAVAAVPTVWPRLPRHVGAATQRDRAAFEVGIPRLISRPDAPAATTRGERAGKRVTDLGEVDVVKIGFVALLVGALGIALGLQLLGRPRSREEWGITTVAAFLGGIAGGELFGVASQWGPSVDGLFVLPALIGALAIGGLAAYGQRVTWWGAT